MKRILTNDFDYCHRLRIHLGLGMETRKVRDIQTPDEGKVIDIADLAGLHHHELRQAA